jgi:hypothetical protein
MSNFSLSTCLPGSEFIIKLSESGGQHALIAPDVLISENAILHAHELATLCSGAHGETIFRRLQAHDWIILNAKGNTYKVCKCKKQRMEDVSKL